MLPLDSEVLADSTASSRSRDDDTTKRVPREQRNHNPRRHYICGHSSRHRRPCPIVGILTKRTPTIVTHDWSQGLCNPSSPRRRRRGQHVDRLARQWGLDDEGDPEDGNPSWHSGGPSATNTRRDEISEVREESSRRRVASMSSGAEVLGKEATQ